MGKWVEGWMGPVGWALRTIVLSLPGAKRRGNLPTRERTNPYQALTYADLHGFLTAGTRPRRRVLGGFLLYSRIGILYGQLNSAPPSKWRHETQNVREIVQVDEGAVVPPRGSVSGGPALLTGGGAGGNL